MRRIYLSGYLALLLILLLGCGSPTTPTVLPSPTPSAEPSTTTQYLVGISTELPLLQMNIAKSFPIRERRVVEPLDELTYQQDLTGIVRMALARPVSNAWAPEQLDATTPITWVLIIPDSESQAVLAWQDIRIDKSPGGASSLVIERAISEVIPFTNDEKSSQDSLQSLIAARDTRYDLDTGAGLWVDSLLMQETDDLGTESWVLYAFVGIPPDPPGGDDWDITVCCGWFGCGGATGDWAEFCDDWGCTDLCD